MAGANIPVPVRVVDTLPRFMLSVAALIAELGRCQELPGPVLAAVWEVERATDAMVATLPQPAPPGEGDDDREGFEYFEEP